MVFILERKISNELIYSSYVCILTSIYTGHYSIIQFPIFFKSHKSDNLVIKSCLNISIMVFFSDYYLLN